MELPAGIGKNKNHIVSTRLLHGSTCRQVQNEDCRTQNPYRERHRSHQNALVAYHMMQTTGRELDHRYA